MSLASTCTRSKTMLDATIVVTAIPRIASSLDIPAESGGLVIVAYVVTAAVLMPLSAWMTQRYGNRRVFPAAIVVFTVGSLGCALSDLLTELVAMRVVQGAGGAMMVPVGRLVVGLADDASAPWPERQPSGYT